MEAPVMGGNSMIRRARAVLLGTISALGLGVFVAPASQANVLSLLPGSCTGAASQPFAPWGDSHYYSLVPGGTFVSGSAPWAFSGGASVAPDSGTLVVGGVRNWHSLSLPGGSSAISPPSCTSIYNPTARLFVRNTGSTSSRLTVQALYPGLLGGVQSATIGRLAGSPSWQPSPAMTLLLSNLFSTLSLNQTVIAFRFAPADNTGHWTVDDVYLDPYRRG
jgi:hypothetical protein